ncbi:hypothetical protein CEXT_296001 [Caerostris extrusa]|uniref:Uncharacterized protein n=1 Tax=Caerostris extrusa TaxID=172846 RepID=A0AAV4UUP4_CAEEX|nr:hypothetical protein CEXT_296001 [Caerostris extrusa]
MNKVNRDVVGSGIHRCICCRNGRCKGGRRVIVCRQPGSWLTVAGRPEFAEGEPGGVCIWSALYHMGGNATAYLCQQLEWVRNTSLYLNTSHHILFNLSSSLPNRKLSSVLVQL